MDLKKSVGNFFKILGRFTETLLYIAFAILLLFALSPESISTGTTTIKMAIGILLGVILLAIGVLVYLTRISSEPTTKKGGGLLRFILIGIVVIIAFLFLRQNIVVLWKEYGTELPWVMIAIILLCIVGIIFKKIGWFTGLVIITIVIIYFYWNPSKKEEPLKNDNTTQKTEDVEVLMYSGYTPCDVKINYHPRFRTEGFPIIIKFNGIKEPVSYPGVGDFNNPIPWKWGMQHIDSGDPANPRVPVKVYKVVQATIS